MAIQAYRVRPGFNYLLAGKSGANPKQFDASEVINLDETIGDRAHQLERVNPGKAEEKA